MADNFMKLVKDKISQYLRVKFELIRLETIERLVNVMGYFAFIMILIFLIFTFSLFVFFVIAETLKLLLGSYIWGYLATSGIILLFCITAGMMSRYIIRFFAGKMAELLTKSHHIEKDAKNLQDSSSL